jgi:DNA-binding IclR family transcriptional regulator
VSDAAGHHVPNYPVAGVSRTLRALELLVSRDAVSVGDLSVELGVGASTAHRLLAMLVFHGYAERTAGSRYRVGPAFGGLVHDAVLGQSTPPHLQVMMERVSESCGETVQVGALVGAEVLYSGAIESPAVLRVSSRERSRRPAHGTSLGRALLGDLEPAELAALYPSEELPALPSGASYTRTRLVEVLDADRRRGWSENHGDVEQGVTSLAVAVSGPNEQRMGMSISGPTTRMPRERIVDLARILRRERKAMRRRRAA